MAEKQTLINLTEKNSFTFRGTVSSSSVDKYGKKLLQLSAKSKRDATIYLVLDSPGGSIYAGSRFITIMQSIPQKVSCIVKFAASMAHSILQYCTGNRYALSNGVSMIHRARGGFYGQFNDGEIEKQLEFWKSIINSMEVHNSKRMKMSLKDYKKYSKDEFWCYGYNCKKWNFVDKITNITCSEGLIKGTEEVSTYSFMGRRRTIVYSLCPLLNKSL